MTALNQNLQLIQALTGGAEALFGKRESTRQSGTTTQQTMLSQEAINHLLRGLMEGTTGRPGLAAISSSQNAPGMYNTTTRNLLVNDLISRATGEVAERAAPKVTSQDITATTQRRGMLSSPTGLLGGAALLLGSKQGKKLLEQILGTGNTGTSVGGDLASMSAPDLVSSDTVTIYPEGALASQFANSSGALDYGLLAAQDYADFGMQGVESLLGSLGGDSVMASMAVSDFADFGVEGLTALADSASFAGDIAGGMSGIGDAGDFISGMEGGIPFMGPMLNLAQGNVGGAIGGVIGNMILPGIGGVIGGMLGGLLGDDCFITTAICEVLGKADDCHELQVLRNFRDTWLQTNHPDSISEYYRDAPEIVTAIKQHPEATAVFTGFYSDYIVPAISAIEAGEMQEAYQIYRSLYNFAKDLASVTLE